MIPALPDIVILPVVRGALAEDLGRAGDVTSQACIAADARFTGVFRARKPGRIAGLDCARLALAELDPTARFEEKLADGSEARPGDVLAKVEGSARAILSAERTALNLLGRLSGIATLTAAYVKAIEGLDCAITDTRKTTPGLRALEKHAVRCGGGINHRFGLDDAILIKDNHVAAVGGVGSALERALALGCGLPVRGRMGNAGGGPAEWLSGRLGAPVYFLGTGLPEDHWHASDESIDLDMLVRGAATIAHLWRELRPPR